MGSITEDPFMSAEANAGATELAPGGHIRLLPQTEWRLWMSRCETWRDSVGSGVLAWVTSPLGAPLEVLQDSAEHALCVRHTMLSANWRTTFEIKAEARRLARPEIAAESAFNEDRILDFEALALAHAEVIPHILSLTAWSPQGFRFKSVAVLEEARHLARCIAARRAAMEALGSQQLDVPVA